MNKKNVILIFDIGKTAKKASIFDAHFHVLEDITEYFPEIEDDGGFPSDDLRRVSEWVSETFDRYLNHPKFTVTHCNISSYGASLVHLDDQAEVVAPFYNYLKPLPENMRELFFKTYDSDHNILAETASPYLGLLNSGLQLYWLKHDKRDHFAKIKTTLHLPQYFCQLLTGRCFSDITSIGCHTLLWSFLKNDYHEWVDRENLRPLFPAIRRADHVFTHQVAGQSVQVGIGVHDSSAALMPYLATQSTPFLLLSTGTWNIAFNPFNQAPLTESELALDCLCFMTYEGKAVKASRIFLGHEHEQQARLLASHFKVSENYYQTVLFDERIYAKLEAEGDGRPFYPVSMEGTGPLPEKPQRKTDLTTFDRFEEAYHQLMRYLVRWQYLSLELIDPKSAIKEIIVVGGFTRNQLFLEILKRSLPDRRILVSDHPRASALGAAWLVTGPAGYAGKTGLLSVTEF